MGLTDGPGSGMMAGTAPRTTAAPEVTLRYQGIYSESPFERWSRRFGLFILAPLFLLTSLAVVIRIAQKPELGLTVHELRVVSVVPDGPAARAGLRKDDVIKGVGNRIVRDMTGYYSTLARHLEIAPLPVLVDRDGQNCALVLVPGPPGQARLIRNYSLWVVGLTFLMIGWWVLLRRPDPVTRNFFSLCFIFAFFLMEIPDLPVDAYMWIKERLRLLLQFLLPAYFLRFFLQFPSLRRTPQGEAAKLRLLLVPGWALFAASLGVDLAGLDTPGRTLKPVLEIISLVYMSGFFLAGLVIFGKRASRKDRPIQRSKMRVILIGLAGGLVPFLAAAVVGNLAPGSALPQWQYLAFSLLLVPASFGLAIMRFGALDRDFIVRTSMTYGLLTALVLCGYLVVIMGLSQVFENWLEVDSERLLLVLVALSGLVVLPLRRLVQGWVDRAFYPSRKATRRTMSAIAQELTGLIEAEDVISHMKARLVGLFRPQAFHLYLAADSAPGVLAPWGGTGAAGAPGFAEPPLPVDSGLARLLDRLRRPIFTEEIDDLLLGAGTDPVSLDLPTRLGAQLLVPLVTGNRLLGFLAFGDKKGGSLYSQDDLANLQTLAVQAAPVIESRRLYQDSLRQKRLETELQLAKEIQSSLLPTGSLSGPGFVIAGCNQACRMVGGDYFDYFLRSDGTLGFAIGDVSGKGIPAALLMASLRVAFRSEAEASPEPREVVRRVNRQICALITHDRFVAFFYGILDPRTRRLRYCNAGMEPPLVFRHGTGITESLKRGGMVLGVAPDHAYRGGELTLAAGDVLFLFTDGLSEQQNPAGEFFDGRRLQDAVTANLHREPVDLLGELFCTVDAFGSGVESDDRTAIILKINDLNN